MRIGIIDVDSKEPNLALMKLSGFHKSHGHTVDFYSPVEAAMSPFDRVYASKVFTNTPDYPYMPDGAWKSGTGYGDPMQLPKEIEHCMPDYDLYKVDYSLGFTSRGCIRRCPFCIVPEKEGNIKEHSPLAEFVKHRKVVLLDNNFLASPKAEDKLLEMIDRKLVVDFNQGLDIRLMNDNFARLLTMLNPPKLRFAWDYVGMEYFFKNGIVMLKKAGYKVNRKRVQCYLLCNYNSTFNEDLYRVLVLRSMDISPFVMVYNKHAAPRYMRELSSWCNIPQQFNKHKTFNEWLTARKLPPMEMTV